MFAVIPTQQALDAEEMSDTGPGTAHKEEMQLTAGTWVSTSLINWQAPLGHSPCQHFDTAVAHWTLLESNLAAFIISTFMHL